jgi:hypothetical protein
MAYLSHKEKYEEGVRRAVIIAKKIRALLVDGKINSDQSNW